MEYFVIENKKIHVSKSHDLYHIHFNKDDRFTLVKWTSWQHIQNFIRQNISNANAVIVCYYFLQRDPRTGPLVQFISDFNPTQVKAKIVFFTNDYWYHPGYKHNQVLTMLFTPKNHYTVTYADNLAQLESFHNKSYAQYQDRFIFNNIWSAYNSAFVDFNQEPLSKIVISGTTSLHYPERRKFLSIKHSSIYKLKLSGYEERSYTKRLNKYLCCFTSSPHVTNMTNKKRQNTHLIVLKYFEILASGSLLLCPSNAKITALGLVDRVNCFLCDMNDPISAIKYITDPTNRDEIDKIRQAGQELARTSLNSHNKYNEILKQLDNLT